MCRLLCSYQFHFKQTVEFRVEQNLCSQIAGGSPIVTFAIKNYFPLFYSLGSLTHNVTLLLIAAQIYDSSIFKYLKKTKNQLIFVRD